MNIRALVPLALLSSVLVLSACGNKGPLLPPPAPEDEQWPEDRVEEGGVDTDADIDADANDDPNDDPAPPAAGADGEDDEGDGRA